MFLFLSFLNKLCEREKLLGFFLKNIVLFLKWNIFTVGKVHLGLNLPVELKSDRILDGVALRRNQANQKA